jgi:hypothetical protein
MSRSCGPATICIIFRSNGLTENHGETERQAKARGSRASRRCDFSPKPLTIRYRNFRGEEKTFTADEESLRRKHNHIIARVVPTGEEISLSRIQNLDEVDYAAPQKVERVPRGPTARERQVLAYHKKYKTTSPLYESIRAKYPDW